MEQNLTNDKQEKCIHNIVSIQKIIRELNTTNVEESVMTILSSFDNNSMNDVLCNLFYRYFVARILDFDICLNFINVINQKENHITDIFTQLLLDLDTQESNFLLEKLIEKEMINPNVVKSKKTLYFIHYQTQNEIKSLNSCQFYDETRNNIELFKNDWKLHKQLIKEGHNPNEIAKIIRNDEIEKLQEISFQPNFNFSQPIKPSLYERCSYINQSAVTLIDYAAFFGSVKCFKYLLLNNARLMNTGKYAVAGGNLEIIHLCEQNHSSFSNSIENVIKFHRNDIFDYIYENKIFGAPNINHLVRKCITSYNYELFLFFKEKAEIKIDDFFSDIIKSRNIYLVKCFLENIDLGKAFIASSEIGIIEIVKLLLKQEGINVNAKDNDGSTALIKASEKGHIEIVKLLLEQKGIDINAKDIRGKTALIFASEKGHTKIVELLLQQKKIEINAKDKIYFNNFIFQNNIWKLFKLLQTALIWASTYGKIEIVKLLLEQKRIKVNARDKICFNNFLFQNNIWKKFKLFNTAYSVASDYDMRCLICSKEYENAKCVFQ